RDSPRLPHGRRVPGQRWILTSWPGTRPPPPPIRHQKTGRSWNIPFKKPVSKRASSAALLPRQLRRELCDPGVDDLNRVLPPWPECVDERDDRTGIEHVVQVHARSQTSPLGNLQFFREPHIQTGDAARKQSLWRHERDGDRSSV